MAHRLLGGAVTAFQIDFLFTCTTWASGEMSHWCSVEILRGRDTELLPDEHTTCHGAGGSAGCSSPCGQSCLQSADAPLYQAAEVCVS